MSILFLNILTLLAPTQAADNLFHSFAVHCENDQIKCGQFICACMTSGLCHLKQECVTADNGGTVILEDDFVTLTALICASISACVFT